MTRSDRPYPAVCTHNRTHREAITPDQTAKAQRHDVLGSQEKDRTGPPRVSVVATILSHSRRGTGRVVVTALDEVLVSAMIDDKAFGPRPYLGVMVSSTFWDLEQHRAKLMSAISGQGLHPVAMEQDAALPAGTVIDSSLAKVRDAAAYVGVISFRYGQIPEDHERNPERLSLTELEFREARRLGRPILIFIMSREHDVKPAAVEVDPIKICRLDAFREEVKRASEGSTIHRVYKVFDSLQDFEVAATQSVAGLRRLLDEQSKPVHDDSRASARRGSNDGDGIPAPPEQYAEPPYIGSDAFLAKALRVVIEHAEWSNFRYLALILEMRVSVTNRTDTRKQLAGFQLQIHSGGQVADGSKHLEVSREVEHRKQRHNALDRISVLEPGETVTGWMVYAFPWKTTPGEPEYTFSVIDELKNQYEAAKAYAGNPVGGR
jgi:hypothetical protein